jgi:hypothetical protein
MGAPMSITAIGVTLDVLAEIFEEAEFEVRRFGSGTPDDPHGLLVAFEYAWSSVELTEIHEDVTSWRYLTFTAVDTVKPAAARKDVTKYVHRVNRGLRLVRASSEGNSVVYDYTVVLVGTMPAAWILESLAALDHVIQQARQECDTDGVLSGEREL